MRSVEKITDPTGRVIRIRELDDRGERFPIIQAAPANCRGLSDYQEVFRTEQMERARRGQLSISVDYQITDAATFSDLFLEIRVVGYVGGGAGEVLEYFTLDRQGLGEFEWDEPESYSALSIEARQNIDGANVATITGINWLNLNVVGAYWR